MLKNVSWRKLVQRLKRLGFDGPHAGGRHLYMSNGELKLHIPNPHGKDIDKSLVVKILKQAGISTREWESV